MDPSLYVNNLNIRVSTKFASPTSFWLISDLNRTQTSMKSSIIRGIQAQ